MSLQTFPKMRPILAAGSVARIQGGNQIGIQLDRLSLSDSEKFAGAAPAVRFPLNSFIPSAGLFST